MNRRPCGCCGPCDFICDVPNPVCITIDVCGQVIVVDNPTLQSELTTEPVYTRCFYTHYEELTFDDEISPEYDCYLDERADTGKWLCPLDPESPSGYGVRRAFEFDLHVVYTLVRTGSVTFTIKFNPTTNAVNITIVVQLNTVPYAHFYGTIKEYHDTTCPASTPTWVLVNTTTYDVSEELPGVHPAYTGTYILIEAVTDCENLLKEYIVDLYSGTDVDLSFTYESDVLMCQFMPSHDFGTLGCGAGVAYVTLANSPCV